MKLDRFILLLISMILLAYWVPGIERIIPLDNISQIGISGIFFFYGLKMSPSQMKEGMANWKLHITVQSATFILFPVLVLGTYPLITQDEYFYLWLAVFFLASLPSTVSSSVVMVSIAKGNIPGAIFNASLSGLIGIIITPLWIGIFLESKVGSFDLGQTFLELIVNILLPVLIGMLLHRFWGKIAIRNKRYITLFDKTVILIIVYKSFANSFSSGLFERLSLFELSIVGLGAITLFFVVYMLIRFMSRKLSFSREDEITALFCGSKKSLVHGTVFSSVLLADMNSAGVFLIPIMIYHAFQLMYISVVAQRYARAA